jgi:hypothetical protein
LKYVRGIREPLTEARLGGEITLVRDHGASIGSSVIWAFSLQQKAQ